MKIKDLKLDENFNITRFTYKPGWLIKVVDDNYYDYIKIYITHKDQPDASKFKINEDYKQEIVETLPVTGNATIFKDSFKQMNFNDFVSFVFYEIKKLEMHEVKEWFKVDGLYFQNPHPGDFVPGIPESECFNAEKT